MSMTTLTHTQLAEIEARADAATPGPWYRLEPPWLPSDVETAVLAGSPDPHASRLVCDMEIFGLDEDDDQKAGNDWNDAAFIAHARQDVPALIAHARALEAEPIPMLLFCPQCGMQHIDQIETTLVWTGGAVKEPSHEETTWDNPPHRSHLCAGCGHIWRPCDRATTGVAAISTKGHADGSAYPATLIALEAERDRLKAECERLRGEAHSEDRDHERTIGERDAAEDAMQDLDRRTGGNGEYYASTINPNAPSTAAKMADGIADRYAALMAKCDQMRVALRQHHDRCLQDGLVGLPDGKGGYVEVDMADVYGESQLFDETAEALQP